MLKLFRLEVSLSKYLLDKFDNFIKEKYSNRPKTIANLKGS